MSVRHCALCGIVCRRLRRGDGSDFSAPETIRSRGCLAGSEQVCGASAFHQLFHPFFFPPRPVCDDQKHFINHKVPSLAWRAAPGAVRNTSTPSRSADVIKCYSHEPTHNLKVNFYSLFTFQKVNGFFT